MTTNHQKSLLTRFKEWWGYSLEEELKQEREVMLANWKSIYSVIGLKIPDGFEEWFIHE